MIFNNMAGASLPDLSNPGTAGDLLSGKQLIDQDGNVLTGTIPTKTSSDLTASGATVTVPSGYYASQATKSVATATQATPSISVSSSGLITASSTQSAGYVSAGTKSATSQLSTQAGTTITPGTSNKTAVASGKYTTGTVYVAGSSNLTAANIKSGVSIFGVTGTLASANVVTFGSYWENPTIKNPSIAYSGRNLTFTLSGGYKPLNNNVNQSAFAVFLIMAVNNVEGLWIFQTDPTSSTDGKIWGASLNQNSTSIMFGVAHQISFYNNYFNIYLSGLNSSASITSVDTNVVRGMFLAN